VETIAHSHLDRAIAEANTGGLTQLVLDRKHRVVGASIVGPRAGETLGELGLAVKHGMRTRDLAGATHPYPTYNDGPWNAAIADVRSQLARPITSRLIRTFARGRSSWLRLRNK
ncbi:MAG: oxidoreductase, partial [Microbacteriaceae bacterium]